MKLISPLQKLDAAPRQSSSLKLLLFLALGASTAVAQTTGGTGSSGSGTTGTSGSSGSTTGSTSGSGSSSSSGSGSTASAGDFSQVQSWLSVQGTPKNGALIVHFDRKDIGNTNLMGSRVSNELVADGLVAFYPLPDFTVQSSSGTSGSTSGSTGSSTSGSTASGASSGSSGATGSTSGSSASGSSSTSGNGTTAGLYDPFNVIYQTASLNTAGGPWFLMTAEIPLLESEVNPFLRQLNRSDITVAAVHNHYLMDNPRFVFVHLEGVVNQARVQIFKSAIAATGIGAITDGTQNKVARLNQGRIASILGGDAMGSADVVEVSIPRDEQFSSCAPALAQTLFNRESQGTSIALGASGQYGSTSSSGSTGASGSTGSTGTSGSTGSTGTTGGSSASTSGTTASGSTSTSGSASSTTDASTFTPATGNGSSADWLTLSGCNATVGSSFAGANGGSSTGTSTSGTTGSTTTGTTGTGTTTSTDTLSMGAVQIPNQMIAFSEIRMQADGNDQAFLVGELALLPTEVDLSRRSLIAQGFSVSAVHNHSATLSPGLLFLHIAKHGDAMQMSQVLRRVMDQNRVAAGQISSTGNGTNGSGSSTGTGATGTGSTGTGTGTGTTGTGTGTTGTGTGTTSGTGTGTGSTGSGTGSL